MSAVGLFVAPPLQPSPRTADHRPSPPRRVAYSSRRNRVRALPVTGTSSSVTPRLLPSAGVIDSIVKPRTVAGASESAALAKNVRQGQDMQAIVQKDGWKLIEKTIHRHGFDFGLRRCLRHGSGRVHDSMYTTSSSGSRREEESRRRNSNSGWSAPTGFPWMPTADLYLYGGPVTPRGRGDGALTGGVTEVGRLHQPRAHMAALRFKQPR
jgi:hypothetical protein